MIKEENYNFTIIIKTKMLMKEGEKIELKKARQEEINRQNLKKF